MGTYQAHWQELQINSDNLSKYWQAENPIKLSLWCNVLLMQICELIYNLLMN